MSRLFRGAVALAVLLVVSTLLVPGRAAAFPPPIIPPIVIPPVQATVYAHSPTTPEYRPTGYSHNNRGGILIRRTGVGAYTVMLEDASSTINGVAHVVAYGANPRFCTIADSYPGINVGHDETGKHIIKVRCFNATGAPIDSPFIATYTNVRHSTNPGRLTYFTTDQAVPTGVRTIPNNMSYNSTGAPITYQRVSVGRYQVDFGPWPSPIRRSPQSTVTAHSETPVHCQWYLPYLPINEVRCFDAAGNPTDARFSWTINDSTDLVGNSTGPRYSSSIVRTEHFPGDGRVNVISYNSVYPDCGDLFCGASVTLLGTGRYQVTIDGLATPYGIALASSRGWDYWEPIPIGYCVVAGWYPSGSDQVVRVNCYEYGGTPANLEFDLQFTTWPAA